MATLVSLMLPILSVSYPSADVAILQLGGFALPADAVGPAYTEDFPYTVQPPGDFRGFQYGFTYTTMDRLGSPFEGGSIQVWSDGVFRYNFTNNPSHAYNDDGTQNFSDLGYWYFGGSDVVASALMAGAEIHINSAGIDGIFPTSAFSFQVYYYGPGVVAGRTFMPPLRIFPRSDGRGASSAPRIWPRPPTGDYGRIGPGSLI